MQPHDDVRGQFSVLQHGAKVGEVHVVPESGAVLAVVQQRRGDVLALLECQVQSLPLSKERHTPNEKLVVNVVPRRV